LITVSSPTTNREKSYLLWSAHVLRWLLKVYLRGKSASEIGPPKVRDSEEAQKTSTSR
jgi:hypothetical protein